MEENILFIGSGFSFHNMGRFDFTGSTREDSMNNAFQEGLIALVCGALDQASRWQAFAEWEKIPSARYCHPREEHLLPLHICAGLSDDPDIKVFDDFIAGKRATAFLWE